MFPDIPACAAATRLFLANPPAVPVEKLAKYAGQWVAWSPDDTHIAAGPELLDAILGTRAMSRRSASSKAPGRRRHSRRSGRERRMKFNYMGMGLQQPAPGWARMGRLPPACVLWGVEIRRKIKFLSSSAREPNGVWRWRT